MIPLSPLSSQVLWQSTQCGEFQSPSSSFDQFILFKECVSWWFVSHDILAVLRAPATHALPYTCRLKRNNTAVWMSDVYVTQEWLISPVSCSFNNALKWRRLFCFFVCFALCYTYFQPHSKGFSKSSLSHTKYKWISLGAQKSQCLLTEEKKSWNVVGTKALFLVEIVSHD